MSDPSTTGRPHETGRLPRDFAVGLAILTFCAAVYWISLGIGEAPAALAQNVQPATFPQMVLSVIMSLTVLMMALGLREKEKRRGFPKPVMLVTAGLMIAFVIAFEALGPLAAMFLFCLVAPLIWGAKPSVWLVGFAVLFPTFIHLLFDVALQVYFPPGVIENLIDKVMS